MVPIASLGAAGRMISPTGRTRLSPNRGKNGKNGFGRTIPDRGQRPPSLTWEDSDVSRRLLTTALASAAVAVSASPAPAIDLGLGLFKRKTPTDQQPQKKADPALKVKQLVATLQADPDVEHRKAAAVELKVYDPRSHTDILTALTGTLQKDPSPDVRGLAAETIGTYRTVSQTAAAALESVEANDPDKSVRAAAKSALWQYGLNGYKAVAPTVSSQTAEPPLAKAVPASKPNTTRARTVVPPTSTEVQFRPITQGPAKGGTFSQSEEPPLARPTIDAKVPVTAPTVPGVPQRMPSKVDAPIVTSPKPSIPTVPLPETKTVEPPRSVPANTVVTPVDPNPTLPIPLPSIPSVPQVMPTTTPTVQPPSK